MSYLLVYLGGVVTGPVCWAGLVFYRWVSPDEEAIDRAYDRYAHLKTAPAEPESAPRHALKSKLVTSVTYAQIGRNSDLSIEMAPTLEQPTGVHRNPVLDNDPGSIDVTSVVTSGCWVPPELMQNAS